MISTVRLSTSSTRISLTNRSLILFVVIYVSCLFNFSSLFHDGIGYNAYAFSLPTIRVGRQLLVPTRSPSSLTPKSSIISSSSQSLSSRWRVINPISTDRITTTATRVESGNDASLVALYMSSVATISSDNTDGGLNDTNIDALTSSYPEESKSDKISLDLAIPFMTASATTTTGTGTDNPLSGDNSNNNDNNENVQSLSLAAEWHKQRRKQMMDLYGKEFRILEQSSSQWIGLPILLLGNISLLLLSIWCGGLSLPAVFGLAIFPGSILSLWQLQILHDVLHGSALSRDVPSTITLGPSPMTITKAQLQRTILFWGSMPSVFGYYLYLSRGHLSHHKNVGSQLATLERLFDSNQLDFEDGDVLFVSHRMNLKGPVGPQFPIPDVIQQILGAPAPETFRLSLSRTGFGLWKEGDAVWNAIVFSTSFLLERYALCWNDVVVAVTGRNDIFFPNKPDVFHKECATYARCAMTVRLSLLAIAGWKALLFLYLSESLWSIPPHPACAMFVTNHGSSRDGSGGVVDDNDDHSCRPSSSTYAGAWYSWMTLGTNYHVEHHDFPNIPFHLLYRCKQIAPEFYPTTATTRTTSSSGGQEQRRHQYDNIFDVMRGAFSHPDFYACSDASPGSLIVRTSTSNSRGTAISSTGSEQAFNSTTHDRNVGI